MRKITIVMTYFNRKYQLLKTLESLNKSSHDNFDVIIVDDASKEMLFLDKKYNFDIRVINITKEEKFWTNPEIAYNRGIYAALQYHNPEIIILQNAECIHFDDVLLYTENNLISKNYLSFGCFSLDSTNTFLDDYDIIKIIAENSKTATFDGECSWYNHTIYRPTGFDFCSAITVDNMKLLNGYDERFSYGVAYGDNYLLHRIRNLFLAVEIIDHPFVIHQWHYSDECKYKNAELVMKNATLFAQLSESTLYRAEHILTPNFE